MKTINYLTKLRRKKTSGKPIGKAVFDSLTIISETTETKLTYREQKINNERNRYKEKLLLRKKRRLEKIKNAHSEGLSLTDKQLRRYIALSKILGEECLPEIIEQFNIVHAKDLSYSRNHIKKPRKERNPRSRKPRVVRYKTYIKSSAWTARKNKYWNEFGRKCARCGGYEFLCLHHMYYDNKTFGNEPNKYLVGLCRVCHDLFHKTYGVKKNMIKLTNFFISDK